MIQGSFRNVPFRTTTMRTQFGQRRGVYELPYDSQGAASVDLGRRARRYAIEALLIQRDYDSVAEFEKARDDLIAALEQPGPGLLVHPTLGSVMVLPGDSIEVTEDTTALGVVSIRFEAVESRAQAAPTTITSDARSALPQVAATLHAAADQDLSSRLKTAGYPEFVANSSIAAIDTALTSLRNLNGFISAQLSAPGRIASQIDAIANEIVSAGYAPEQLYAALQNAMLVVFTAITRVASATGDIFAGAEGASLVNARVVAGHAALRAASTDLAGDIEDAGTRDTPARAQERQNTAAIRNAVRAAQFGTLVSTLNDLDYDSRTEASTLLAAVLERADQLLSADALDAAVFDAVDAARAKLQTRLRNLSLTASTTLATTDEIPACVLAYRLYGDAERGDTIVARNSIAHPTFVPSDTDLEVLVS